MSERGCDETRRQLLDYLRGALAAEDARALEGHVAGCAACAAALAEERTVNELLRTRLPAAKAPERLQRAVAAQVARALAGSPNPAPAPFSAAAYAERDARAAGLPITGDTPAEAPLPAAVAAHAGTGDARDVGMPPTAEAASDAPLLAARAGTAEEAKKRGVGRRGWLVASLGVASLAAVGLLGVVMQASRPAHSLEREALNDHLRVLYAQNPVEVPNGGLHQVKPWFTGRVDFAPDVTFVGDDEFPMVGGAVGYFVDRRAASFVFKRRLHTISLFVFRSDGPPWSDGEAQRVAGKQVQVSTLDGFHLVYWDAEGLGHVLVSDVSSPELLHLTEKLLQ